MLLFFHPYLIFDVDRGARPPLAPLLRAAPTMEGVAVALSNEVGTELKPAAETADSWAAASVAATELEAVEDEAFNTSAGADSLRMDD